MKKLLEGFMDVLVKLRLVEVVGEVDKFMK